MPIFFGMITILTILVALSMLATLGVLFAGMVGMVRGDGDGARANGLMRWRVTLQGVALALFALLLLLMRS
ncbi:twin transmembrane helix small protein [Roseomonas sp. BN140053]|uniref:twin transmembrane helix small protein n=1 Tax=Roseomonas sp. BN140053 TaxID=3391898 RepID=UPI0039EA9449